VAGPSFWPQTAGAVYPLRLAFGSSLLWLGEPVAAESWCSFERIRFETMGQTSWRYTRRKAIAK
jgi:hypothetical protein